MGKEKAVKQQDTLEELIIDPIAVVNELMPTINGEITTIDGDLPAKKDLIEDEQLIGMYDRILNKIDDDCKEVDELLANFVDMVVNGGDATNSSKEAVCNLIKIKSDAADKMIKIADLMTRVKMKEANPYHPKFAAKNQQNNINFQVGPAKLSTEDQKAMIEEIN